MPVDKFGRMDDVKPSDDGASLTYINNNFLRKDGTTEVTGSINMNGNTLTRNPVNPQDVATKDYVDSNAGILDENGGYVMREYLNMGFNKIKNLGDPTEPSEAANKKYVDESGKAIVQRQDGTFHAIANINMEGYQLTNVLEPAEPQDVATKNYVDGANRAFIFGPGGYIASNDVSMGGRRINNLGTPLDNQQAANKFYVDNVVAIATALTKNPDGSFSADGQIDMKGNRITNLPEPAAWDDPVTRSFLSRQMLTLSERKLIKPVISVHAEEQGSLLEGNYGFSFGNGSSGRSHGLGGYCMSAPGRITRGSLIVLKGNRFLDEEIKINLVVNGDEKTDYSLIKKRGEGCSYVIFPQPLEIKQCDVINFLTKTSNTNVKNAYLSILIELDL